MGLWGGGGGGGGKGEDWGGQNNESRFQVTQTTVPSKKEKEKE